MPGFRSTVILLSIVLGVKSVPLYSQSEPVIDTVTIGTGGTGGVYYPAGGAICQLINLRREQRDLRCLVEATKGSVYNLKALGYQFPLAIVQSDWQFHAYHGSNQFSDIGPNTDLRSVFALHSEPFTVVARKDSGIRTFTDLADKRVNIGNPGSGQRATLEVVLNAYGWDTDKFSLALELEPSEQISALCDGVVDAIVYTVGHPNSAILEATTACDSVIVAVDGPVIDGMVERYPYYTHATIPAGMYRGNPENITSFGVKATLVTTTALPTSTVYRLVETVFEHFDEFRRLHPALLMLERHSMVSEGNSAPLHDGAADYYRQHGLLLED